MLYFLLVFIFYRLTWTIQNVKEKNFNISVQICFYGIVEKKEQKILINQFIFFVEFYFTAWNRNENYDFVKFLGGYFFKISMNQSKSMLYLRNTNLDW